jgi:hypothetical protein
VLNSGAGFGSPLFFREDRMSEPVVFFKQLVPGAIGAGRAPRDAYGVIPIRGARYCEPLTSACAYGWHVFPLIGFEIQFDGVDIAWTYDGAEDWYPLESCQYPHFVQLFDEAAPDDIKGFSPPWLAKGQSPGVLQIWTGFIVRTVPDWSLLLRAAANIPHSPGYFHLDGIIETDRWCGGLFFIIKLLETGRPIRFDPNRPYLQIQAVHRRDYGDDWLNNAATFERGLDKLTEDDWRAYHRTVVVPNSDPHRTLGHYAVTVRKRRAAERTDQS